ncbi:hypothetical protein MA20_45490 [Bradyrhizobium japonicum]|uniref:Uncharacterized protein n=2 Tax=Bradyrhizobium japonicum TaxID=375 RepID=A0A0A3XJB0_BRAJP|nr:hypothetical protein MA20_45490 [Bradyrhizobium japonicum]
MDFPAIRWTLSHMRELGTTANVRPGGSGPSQFERSDRAAEIDVLTFVDMNGRTSRFEALYDTYVEGIAVLHRGRIVYERCFGALEFHLPCGLLGVEVWPPARGEPGVYQ